MIETLALVIVSVAIALGLRLRAGPLMVAMALGALLQDVGVHAGRAAAPAAGGVLHACRVEHRLPLHTRDILVHVAHAFPRVAVSILTLIAICGVFAAALVLLTGVTPLTAYLATSPGGANSVAIIAASANVDAPFVMSMQLGRALFLLFAGPALARLVVRYAPGLPVGPE